MVRPAKWTWCAAGLAAAVLVPGLFSPAVAGESTIRVAGRDVVVDSARLREARRECHCVLALARIPTAADRKTLDDLGVVLLEYLQDSTWTATVPADAAERLLETDFVIGGEPFRGEWKEPPGFPGEAGRRLWRLRDGNVEAHVYFHRDVPETAARRVLAEEGFSVESPAYVVRNRLRVSGPEEAVLALRDRDEVAWIESARIPMRPANATASAVHGVDVVAEAPFGLDGAGVRVGVMDQANVDTGHVEFGGRATLLDPLGVTANAHATHVTGTILGDGSTLAAARGMAPAARSWHWTWEDGDYILKKEFGLKEFGIEVDNNAFVTTGGWNYINKSWYWFGDDSFGLYAGFVGDLDGIAIDSDTLMVWAAGDERYQDGYDGVGWFYYCYDDGSGYSCDYFKVHVDVDLVSGNAYYHDGYHGVDGGETGLDTLSWQATMKNGLCVASIDADGNMAPFSSLGPPADGRVKPDCVAVGVDVASTVPGDGHLAMSGSSMSSAVASGIAALAVQAWKKSHGDVRPPLEVLKGLLTHGCEDLGPKGPDYRYGFGRLSAEASCRLALEEDGTRLRTGSLNTGDTLEILMEIAGDSGPVRLTLCWIDPPGAPFADRAIVNNIDMALYAPSSEDPIHPWILDGDVPELPAARERNTVDTVEMIEVDDPVPGVWRIVLSGRLLPFAPQEFALWMSHPRFNLAPVANAGPDRQISGDSPQGAMVSLDGRQSTDPNMDDELVSFRWDLDGDGQFDDASGAFTAGFVAMGQTIIKLQVTDAFGATSTDTATILAENSPPVARLGPDRDVRATDPDGAWTRLDLAQSIDAQGVADIVTVLWDLDGDGQYDDGEGSPFPARLPLGHTEVGIRIGDTAGAFSQDRVVLNVVPAEYSMRLGGAFKGELNHLSQEDVDSILFEALDGSTLDLKVKGAFRYRLTLFDPDATELLVHPWEPGEKSFKVKGMALPTSGWYWLEMAPDVPFASGRYSLKFAVRPPAGAFSGSGTTGEESVDHPVELLAGSALAAKLKNPGATFRLLDPEGLELAVASSKGALKVKSVPTTGVHVLRVTAVGEPGVAYDIAWKVKPPRGKSKVKE